jgi:hypothetical protein
MINDLYFIFREDTEGLHFTALWSTDDEKKGYFKLMTHQEKFNYLLDYLEKNI